MSSKIQLTNNFYTTICLSFSSLIFNSDLISNRYVTVSEAGNTICSLDRGNISTPGSAVVLAGVISSILIRHLSKIKGVAHKFRKAI